MVCHAFNFTFVFRCFFHSSLRQLSSSSCCRLHFLIVLLCFFQSHIPSSLGHGGFLHLLGFRGSHHLLCLGFRICHCLLLPANKALRLPCGLFHFPSSLLLHHAHSFLVMSKYFFHLLRDMLSQLALQLQRLANGRSLCL